VLNKTFAGGEGGANTGFSFRLAGVTHTDNADWFYAGPGGTDEHSMKAALHQGGTDALNFYSTTAGPGLLGYAYLPDIVTKPGQAYLDGIVINWESIPGTSTAYAGRYDQGETATHETGHWLDLEHTFYGGCNAKGDFVADTPPEKTPTSGCPAGKDTCSQPGLDPIHNYMDYSYDSCYTEFTQGQTQRMRDAWLFYRA
jgi:pregnancy-associated plasma protein-A